MEYIQDIVIAVMLVLGLISGFITGFFKKFTRIVIFLALFFGLYFGLRGILVDYLRYEVLLDATNGVGLTVQLAPDMVVKVMTLEDLFVVLQNVDENISGLLLKTTCEAACNVAVFIAILLGASLLSFPLGTIFYHILFKFIFFQAGRKPKMLARTFGGVLGIVEAFIFVFLCSLSFGQLGVVTSQVSELFKEAGLASDPQFAQVVEIMKYVIYVLDPNSSVIMGSIINAMNQSGIDPYMLTAVEYNGKNYSLPKCTEEIIANGKDTIIALIKDSTSNQPESNTVKEAVNLYNLSFNF